MSWASIGVVPNNVFCRALFRIPSNEATQWLEMLGWKGTSVRWENAKVDSLIPERKIVKGVLIEIFNMMKGVVETDHSSLFALPHITEWRNTEQNVKGSKWKPNGKKCCCVDSRMRSLRQIAQQVILNNCTILQPLITFSFMEAKRKCQCQLSLLLLGICWLLAEIRKDFSFSHLIALHHLKSGL